MSAKGDDPGLGQTPSAARIRSAIIKGETTARAVAEAALARIAAQEPALNALSEITQADALRAADAVDAARQAGAPLGALAGVPVLVKNNTDQQGTLNTGSIPALAGNQSKEDSPLVANLRAAGAVIVGRSNVPAYSLRWFTDGVLHGRTVNPWDARLSPGGSSGGAGVGVAAGYAPIAHGNDIGGSIRQPAHMNGIFGLRPTVGRVPSYVGSLGGVRALSSQLITADGPMVRHAADLAPMLNAMSGAAPSPMDPQQVPAPPVKTGTLPPRVALMRGSTLGAPEPEVDAALTRAADVLRGEGCTVVEADLPHFERAHAVWLDFVFQAIDHHYLDDIRQTGDAAIIHNITHVLEMLKTRTPLLDLLAERLQLMREWSVFFSTFPMVLLPISYRHGLKVDADQGDLDSLQRLFADQSPLLATALMGNPGLAAPTGLAPDGTPTGVQLLARWWDEDSLIAAALALDKAFPVGHPPL